MAGPFTIIQTETVCYNKEVGTLEKLIKTNKTKQEYGNQSITALKGADRVRKRPGVIFGSDGLEGCEHSFFEIKVKIPLGN